MVSEGLRGVREGERGDGRRGEVGGVVDIVIDLSSNSVPLLFVVKKLDLEILCMSSAKVGEDGGERESCVRGEGVGGRRGESWGLFMLLGHPVVVEIWRTGGIC